MKLIICEKPSLAKTVAEAIGILNNFDGYIRCKDNYVVSYVFGHILNLKEMKDYPENKDKPWKTLTLPFCPSVFEFIEPKEKNKQKQLSILKKLSEQADEIIHCGDADREGQIIIDNVLKFFNYGGKVYRLWLPEQTFKTIRTQLKNMKLNSEYQNLANEGYARTYLDWLYGMNTTVYMTNKVNTLVKVGRVLVPVAYFIYERDFEIEHFQSEKYYILENQDKNLPLKHKKKIKTLEESKRLQDYLNHHLASIEKIEKNEKIQNPPKLFSLSTLQSFLSKKYKISFDVSLNYIQQLYEKGYISYPRTNTEYLTHSESARVDEIIKTLSISGLISKENNQRIYDDTKVEGHTAILPTGLKYEISVSETEKIIYETVLKRFCSVFCEEECKYVEKKVHVLVGEEKFLLKGKTLLQKGFTQYESLEFTDVLPFFFEKDTFKTNFEIVEKMTEAPPKMTEAELSSLLKNPFRKNKKEFEENEDSEKQDDQDEYKAMLKGIEIGTEATRTGIIQKLIHLDYITLDKNKYSITTKGKIFIENLKRMDIPLFKEKNVELSMLLKEVYLGTKRIDELISYAYEDLKKMIEKTKHIEVKSFAEKLGYCPVCSDGEIIDQLYNYSCSQCAFKLNKTICGTSISLENLKDILDYGRTKSLLKFTSKQGKKFKAYLILKDNKISFLSNE